MAEVTSATGEVLLVMEEDTLVTVEVTPVTAVVLDEDGAEARAWAEDIGALGISKEDYIGHAYGVETKQTYMKFAYRPIGIIHSPFKTIEGMPIQPAGAKSTRGTIDILPEFSDGLKDLEGFSHIILLYHFHRSRDTKLIIIPFMDSRPHGVFATRAPSRPNPIGISIVKLNRVRGNILEIENVDILDGTPLLDIKPYVPEFDQYPADKIGWLEDARKKVKDKKSDSRFD